MKEIRRVWKHSHENLPSVGIDSQGRYITEHKEPPFRYMISFDDGHSLCVTEVLAVDELDAVKQFYKEK
jgi:hypothetical protein